jgi:DNA-directed RNA polymerase specialized sigma24 family protein
MNACAAAMTFRCNLCQDRHRLFSPMLKRMIKCPGCTRRARNDPSGLRVISQNEAERRQAEIDRSAMRRAKELVEALEFAERVSSRAKNLDPRRAPVDRVMQRWSVGEGSGLPYTSDELDMAAQEAAEQADTFTAPPAQSPPLDDESQIIVDRTVLHAPKDTRFLIRQWYCSGKPVRVIAEDCDVSPRHIYRFWHDALDYLREKFQDSANVTLLRLIRSQV